MEAVIFRTKAGEICGIGVRPAMAAAIALIAVTISARNRSRGSSESATSPDEPAAGVLASAINLDMRALAAQRRQLLFTRIEGDDHRRGSRGRFG